MGVDVANNRKDYDRIFNDVPLGKRKRYDGGPLGLGNTNFYAAYSILDLLNLVHSHFIASCMKQVFPKTEL